MPLLDKSAILGAKDLVSEDVPVPEWGGDVRVRTMTGTERDAFGVAIIDSTGKFDRVGYRAKLLSRCIVGEDGQPLFTEADIAALGAKSNKAIERVFVVADRLNALGDDKVQDAEKN